VDEPEDLNDDQIAELRGDLLALKDEIARTLTSSAESGEPVALDQTAVGRISRMDAMQVQAMAQANLRSLKLRLDLIGQALRLVEEDEYGTCRRCEEPIGYRRLKARPESPFCLSCQGEIEQR
jgi:DnaK suppressor protein